MSTRSQIGFYASSGDPLDKFEALIYKHCDGYPEGTLQTIDIPSATQRTWGA